MTRFKKLSDHVKEMLSFGNFLLPYNYPLSPKEFEDDISCIKTREICVDGYSLITHYNKANYDNSYFVETLQVLGRFSPFLPFNLVFKIGRSFLGEKHLSLGEVVKDDRKYYCWTCVTNMEGEYVPWTEELAAESVEFQGFEYKKMNPGQLNFY